MRTGVFLALVGTLAVAVLGWPAAAQNPSPLSPPAPERTAAPSLSPPSGQTTAPFTPEQLDQLTAPIALYPDPLVSQVLMAATYPLEIVEADRWLQQPANAALSGDQLAAALAQQRWDPSVKSLVAFPQILRTMDGNLTWTEQLGDAFLAEQPAVMDSVQRLRQRAEAAGRLQSTPQAMVSNDAGVIIIEPPDQNIVYVPVYDPNVVYGAWPYPDYPPDYFPGFFPDAAIGPLGVGWVGVGVVAPLFGWAICDWGHHLIRNDTHRFGASNAGPDVWQHDPSHRGGVPYRDPAVRAQFQSAATAAAIQGARGIPIVAPAAMTTPTGVAAPPFAESAPAVVRSAPRVMQSIGSVPQVPAQVERGQAGRMLAPAPRALAPPHRAVPAAPVPRVVMAVPAARGGASAPRAAPAPYGNAVHR